MEVIDEIYVKTLIDRTTHTIQCRIPEVLELLFDRYAQIDNEDLQEKEEEIKELKYELVDSMVNILNEIEDLKDLGAAADNEYSEQQHVKLVHYIIKNTG